MKQVNIKPSEFAENFLFIEKSKPFSIKDYPFFYDIYDCPSDSLLLRCSRQVGKSITIANYILLNILISEMEVEYVTAQKLSREELYNLDMGSFHALYVAPSGNHVSTFSKQKLTLIINGSPVFNEFLNPRCADQIAYKSFKNGSDLFLRSCFHSPLSIRGISTDMISIDELQDIQIEHIPVILETQVRSKKKSLFQSGTPKTTRNGIEYYWDKSSQNEWVVKCHHCNNWNVLGEENIQPNGLSCAKCKKLIDRRNGQWASMNPKAYTQGFRVHAMMADFIPWTGEEGTKDYEESLMYKYKTYPPAQFYNEVLGLPYDSGTIPITKAELQQACDVNQRRLVRLEPGFHPGLSPHLRDKLVVAGVDWGTSQEGKSRTVHSIIVFIDEKFYILYMKIYGPSESDPKYQVADIIKNSNHYGVHKIGADWGFGHVQNLELSSQFGSPFSRGKSDSVIQFYNHVGIAERRKWNKGGRFYVINRTEVLTDFFHSIKKGKIIFPEWNTFEPFADDIMNIYQEYNFTTNKMSYIHHPEQPDDSAFSLLYGLETAMIMMGKQAI